MSLAVSIDDKVLGDDLGKSLEGDGGDLLVRDGISQLRVEVLVQLHDTGEQLHATLQPGVLQHKFGQGVKFPGGVGHAGVGEDGHGEGLLRGEPRIPQVHVPVHNTSSSMQ